MNKKRALFIMFIFAVVLSLLNLFAVLSINTNIAQLDSLLHSDYIYSVVAHKSAYKNDYYCFNAEICFALSSNAETSLNTDVVMQSVESEYTDSIYWNADKLSTYGIAISKGIARNNGLKVGDKLYSKHIVNGAITEYTIEQILPEIKNVRTVKKSNHSNGVIIMGFDNEYIDNITHVSIAFTNDSLEEFSLKISDMPENIVYRFDEIISIGKKLLPYFLLYLLLSVLGICILVFIIVKEIKYNFRRLIMLGFNERELNNSYNKLVYSIGILPILIASFFSAMFSQFFELSVTLIASLFCLMFAEIFALFLSAIILKKRLWRK